MEKKLLPGSPIPILDRPLKRLPRHARRRNMQDPIKVRRAEALYHGWPGAATLQALWDVIPMELYKSCTGRQLGMLLDVAFQQYQRGRNAAEREAVENGAIWQDGKKFRVKKIENSMK